MMGWSDESVLHLIEGYKNRAGLWDPDHPDYKNLNKKTAHWTSLADEMRLDVDDVKKKLNSLTASFRRERAKERAEVRGYKSTWFAYGALAFLLEKFKGRENGTRTDYTEEVSIEDCIDDGFFLNITESAYDGDSSSHSTSREPVRVLATTTSCQSKSTSGSSVNKRPSRVQASRHLKMVKTEPRCDPVDVHEPISVNRYASQNEKSSIDIFGDLVAAKLREYSDYTRIVVQQKINHVLFDADMGLYNEPEVADPPI